MTADKRKIYRRDEDIGNHSIINNIEDIKKTLDRLEGALFGKFGTNGISGDVNALKQTINFLKWLVGSIGIVVIIKFIYELLR